MSTGIKRKIYAKLFFAIFFMKMVISSAPIFIHGFDRQALLQVVLQLEIENNNGKGGIGDQAKDLFSKFYAKDLIFSHADLPLHYLNSTNFIADDKRHIRAFYPAVPTPPPNC
ncbi:hypothetical protein [Parapedobacter lycopersici]|uniref:hypothetical protein n=1 Tax=Parapedobacter lycopersici TaxID=1864939 RepID=UPI00333F8E58